MSEEAKEAPEVPAEGAAEAAPPPKKGPPIMIIIIVVVVLILGGVAGFLFLTSKGKQLIGLENKEEPTEVLPDNIIYFAVPEIMVNLIPNGKKTPFLRLSLKFEMPDEESTKKIEILMPRVTDLFQTYLRQLRMDDLQGSEGIQRLKEELLKRVNAVIKPIEIRAVLLENMLLQ